MRRGAHGSAGMCREWHMSKRLIKKQFFYIFILSLIVILVGTGFSLLSQRHQLITPGYAVGSDNVVGPPSLPATTVDAILRRLGSPMTGIGQDIEASARAANIDDAFALAVWWTETNDGAAGVGRADRNPGSVRGSAGYPSAYDGYTIYPSYTAAVNYWFPMLKRNYIDRGLTTVFAISHPYVGTSTSSLWAEKVIVLMQRYQSEAPQPASIAIDKPTPLLPSANVLRVEKTLKQQAQRWNADSSVVLQQQNTPSDLPAPPSPLSKDIELLVVFFNLLLALLLSIWAWSFRRYTSYYPPQLAVPTVNTVWEQFQASKQQPSAFFGQYSLSGLLQTTEELGGKASGWLAMSIPTTDTLALDMPDTLSSLDLSAREISLRETLQTSYIRPSVAPAMGSSFNPPAPAFTRQPTLKLPVLSAGGPKLFGPPASDRYAQAGHDFSLPPLPPRMPVSTQGPLHKTRLQSTHAGKQQIRPFPAITGQKTQASGTETDSRHPRGLLSRYREMQAQEEQRYTYAITAERN